MSQQPPWKAWYKTARWRALRLEIFRRDHYRCQCGCGLYELNSALLVCDHRKPHRGDVRLFWDQTNLQTLRKPCHDRDKQRAEQASLHQRGVWY
jgi:5-methylcytosine-specific restriction enzyme A